MPAAQATQDNLLSTRQTLDHPPGGATTAVAYKLRVSHQLTTPNASDPVGPSRPASTSHPCPSVTPKTPLVPQQRGWVLRGTRPPFAPSPNVSDGLRTGRRHWRLSYPFGANQNQPINPFPSHRTEQTVGSTHRHCPHRYSSSLGFERRAPPTPPSSYPPRSLFSVPPLRNQGLVVFAPPFPHSTHLLLRFAVRVHGPLPPRSRRSSPPAHGRVRVRVRVGFRTRRPRFVGPEFRRHGFCAFLFSWCVEWGLDRLVVCRSLRQQEKGAHRTACGRENRRQFAGGILMLYIHRELNT